MHIWIAGGGTGGHVYPGLAVARALLAETPASLLYVGGEGGVEEHLVGQAGIPFVGIPAGGIHGLTPMRAVQNALRLLRGWKAALRLGRRERPAALFATGGYASIPVALAAWTLRVPILVYLPDIEPGWAVRFIARLATRVAVTVEESRGYFPEHKVIVTGYPVRPEFHKVERSEARAALQLTPDEPVLLVMGGSKGASSINHALERVLEQVLELVQVVHLSGEHDWTRVQARHEHLPEVLRVRYHPYRYLHEIWLALAAADLALCRAGASTLGELPFFALPAILVPYPHAWRYQKVNAAWLVERGGALQVDDERLGEELLPTLRRLLSDRAILEEMRTRMRTLARPDAAARLAQVLCALAASSAG